MGAKPILSVSQKTFKPQTQIGMHFESGYLRFPPNGQCVKICVAPFRTLVLTCATNRFSNFISCCAIHFVCQSRNVRVAPVWRQRGRGGRNERGRAHSDFGLGVAWSRLERKVRFRPECIDRIHLLVSFISSEYSLSCPHTLHYDHQNGRPPQVTHVRRVYRWSAEGDRLTYTLAMSTSKTPELTPHLEAELVKQA
jgi:hypothetical protein